MLRARVAAALAHLETVSWPYRRPTGVVEKDAERDVTEIHLVHNCCYLGTARCEDELQELLPSAPPARFDLDQYRILVRHLRKLGGVGIVQPDRQHGALGWPCIVN